MKKLYLVLFTLVAGHQATAMTEFKDMQQRLATFIKNELPTNDSDREYEYRNAKNLIAYTQSLMNRMEGKAQAINGETVPQPSVGEIEMWHASCNNALNHVRWYQVKDRPKNLWWRTQSKRDAAYRIRELRANTVFAQELAFDRSQP